MTHEKVPTRTVEHEYSAMSAMFFAAMARSRYDLSLKFARRNLLVVIQK